MGGREHGHRRMGVEAMPSTGAFKTKDSTPGRRSIERVRRWQSGQSRLAVAQFSLSSLVRLQPFSGSMAGESSIVHGANLLPS